MLSKYFLPFIIALVGLGGFMGFTIDTVEAQSCVYESELRWDWDGIDGRSRCMTQFQQLSTAIPLCRSVGIVAGADATNATVSSCLPYNNGGEACPVGQSQYAIYVLKRSNTCPAITQPPAQPAWVSGSCPNPGTSATISWPAVPGATFYALRADNQNNSWNGSCDPSNTPGDFCGGVTGTSHTIQGSPSSLINTWVHACNSAGCSAPAPNTVFACAPTTPTGLTATPQSCGSGQINLTWGGVPNASGYEISINGGGWSNVGNVTSWNHTGLGANSNYSYRVRAWNAGGVGGASGSVNATAPNVCAPTTPTGLTATPQSCGSGTIRVSWNGVAGANSYDISLNNGASWFNVGNVTSWNHTGLGANSNYTYQVRAWNAGVAGGASGSVNATAPNVCTPAPVASISGSCPVPGSNATVSWPASPGATYYELRVDNQTSPGGWNGSCNASAGDFCLALGATSHSFSATPGHQYNTWVHACNDGGCSAPVSSVFSCGLSAPTNLSATPNSCGTNQLFLDWSDVPSATSYSIYYSNGTFITTTTASNYTFTGGANLQYSFYVRSNNAGGQSPNSSTVTNTTPNTCPSLPNLRINNSDGPITVNYNTVVNLTWTSTHPTNCTLSGAGVPGSVSVTPSSAPGGRNATITQSDTYVLTCGTETDTVQVNLSAQAPNPPTINAPAMSTSGVAGNSIQFRIVSTHPNPTAQFYYTIDWDNDGSADTPSPSGAYTTGQQWTINNTWATAGTRTIRACARDIGNTFPAACTTHTVNIATPAPPSVILQSSVNGGSWVSGNRTINPGDTLRLRWTTTNADTCTATEGSGFSTSGSANGTDTVTPPAANTSGTYTVSCAGAGGTINRSVTITTRAYPNFTQPDVTYSVSSTFDQTTGNYDYIDVTFQTRNDGGSDTLTAANYQLQFDAGLDGYEINRIGLINLLSVGRVFNQTERINDIPFGSVRLNIIVDSDDDVVETNESDNSRSVTFNIPPPNPGLSITADRTPVRSGDTTTIRWSTVATYPTLSCNVRGPGVNLTSVPFSGNRDTQPITAKSEYTLTCTETTTNTTWQDSVSVEVLGELQEI